MENTDINKNNEENNPKRVYTEAQIRAVKAYHQRHRDTEEFKQRQRVNSKKLYSIRCKTCRRCFPPSSSAERRWPSAEGQAQLSPARLAAPVGPDRDRQVAGGNTFVAEIREISQIFPNIYFSLM
jgi:hypothetical protein